MTPGGPITIYRRVRPGEAYHYDGTPERAQRIVDWSAGHAYIAEGQLVIITNRGDVVTETEDTVIHNENGHYYPCPPDDYAAGWQEYDV